MSKRPWITEEQRAALIASYVEYGLEATKPIAISYGISVRTIAYVARRAGKVGKPKPKRNKVRKIRDRTMDRRWQLAVERGGIRI